MMKTLQALILIFLTGTGLPAFSQDVLLNEGLIADVNYYKAILSSKHKDPFTKISKADFNKKVDTLIHLIPTTDKAGFIVGLLKINALIGDEHTIIFPDAELELPFKFELFDEGMTIIATDSINKKYLLHRVLSIDNVPWAKIDTLYRSIIKQDNASYYKFFETYYFGNPKILKGLGIISNASLLEFQFLSPEGDTLNAIIYSNKKTQKTSWQYADQFHNLLAYSENNNYWYRLDTVSNTLYFNYQNCSEKDDETFKSFNKRLFQTIEKTKPDKLVLDLRFNSGGSSGLLKPFIDRIKKSELNSKGRFYILIGRKVMSSSLMNAIELKKTSNATFVGELTGGNINHFGEIASFELPNSKIRVTYSTKYWENWKDQNGGLKPDIEVTNSFFDFMNSYDRALEMILQQ